MAPALLSRAALAAALAAVVAIGGCSLFVDLDGIRPGAGADADVPDDGGAISGRRLQVPAFFGEELEEGELVVLEGIGYPAATLEVGEDGTVQEIDLGAARPIPIVVAGLAPDDVVTLVVPDGFDPPLHICGAEAPAGRIALSGGDLGGCGVSGGIAAFTLAIPIREGDAGERTFEVEVNDGDEVHSLPLVLRGLEVYHHGQDKTDFPDEVFAAIVIVGPLEPSDRSTPIHLRATSAVYISATINASGEAGTDATCTLSCPTGRAGPGNDDGHGGDPACALPPCDGGGLGGGGGGGNCADSPAPGGGGGGHRTDGLDGSATNNCGVEGGGGDGYGEPFPAQPTGGSGGGGGGRTDVSLELSGGGGGGGGGVLLLDTAGRLQLEAGSAFVAEGGRGGDGDGTTGTGGGGGGSGGSIRIRADSIGHSDQADLLAPRVGGGPGGAAGGGLGGRGWVRIDGNGVDFPGVQTEATPIFGPVFVDPLPAVVREDRPLVSLEGRSALTTSAEVPAVNVGVRRAESTSFATAQVAAGMPVRLPEALALSPGLNEVCLLFPGDSTAPITEHEALRRCMWVAYLPP